MFRLGEGVVIYSNIMSLEEHLSLRSLVYFAGIQLDSPQDPGKAGNSNDIYKYL
jgi:hypothetical protein